MKKFVVLIGLFYMSILAQAQIANGSFEFSAEIPGAPGQWNLVPGWFNAGSAVGDPDYYHYLANTVADIPETPVAIVNSAEGNAIMGLMVCGRKYTEQREYLTAIFDSPLEVGRDYTISFKITNGIKTYVSTGGLATDDIGLYFSTMQPAQNGLDPLNFTPQFRIEHVLYEENWQTISFVLHADQAYRYMTLGLFGADVTHEILVMDNQMNALYAYYFVDDFKMNIIPDDNTPFIDPVEKEDPIVVATPDEEVDSPFFVPNTFTPNNDGFNDVFIPVPGTVRDYDLSIFNRWGDCIFFSSDETIGWDGYYNSRLSEMGCYVWEIKYYTYEDGVGLVPHIGTGVVTLVR